MTITIQEATIENLKDIQLLNQKLFEEEYEKYDKTLNTKWSNSKEAEEFYRKRIQEEKGYALVLLNNKKVIGYLVGSLSEDEFYRTHNNFAELDDMYVIEEHRSKGHGSKLYEEFIKWCKKKGVKRVKIVATEKNKQAIKFYKNKGLKDYTLTLEKDV